MIKYCCYYCQGFRKDTCKEPICYNAFGHPQTPQEGKWFCEMYEGGECGETITHNGKMAEAHKDCWVESDIKL